MGKQKAAAKPKEILKPAPHSGNPGEVQKKQAEGAARTFRSFAGRMKQYFPEMRASDRDVLLKNLYALCFLKTFSEWYGAGERKEADAHFVFRKYRLWLAKLDEKLRKVRQAMHEVVQVADKQPKRDELDKIDAPEDALDREELAKLVVRDTVIAIVHAGNELGNVIARVKHLQYELAAATNPKLRTRAEKKLVPKEPGDLRHNELLREKSRKIDLRFIHAADSMLDEYSDKDGKPLRGRSQKIRAVFEHAFGVTKTEGSITKELSPSREKSRQRPSN